MTDLVTSRPRSNVIVTRTKISEVSTQPSVSFTMPAFNEEDNIERTVNECQAAFDKAGLNQAPVVGKDIWGEIVVTNDCSKDRTGEILSGLQESMLNLVIVTHEGVNQGYGRALSDAIAASRGEWVATIDSDGQFDPMNLPEMIASVDPSDTETVCVAGYRMKKKDSFIRVFADRGLNTIVRTLFGIRHRDTNCAFKLILGDVIRDLNIETNGFQTPTEIVLKLNAMGLKMVECGVTHRVREEGKSKLKVIKTSMDFLRFLWYLRGKIGLYKRGILGKL